MGRPNILHGSIESAIPENPLVGANISGLSAIQADLQGDFVQILGSKFWALGGLIKNLRTTFRRVPHGELTAKNGSIPSRNKKEEAI